jgi:hypothetical protein
MGPTKKKGQPRQEFGPTADDQKIAAPSTTVPGSPSSGKQQVKSLRQLPRVKGDPPAPPPLEAVPPHKALARANQRHAQLTEELRQLKADWAAKNIKAQQCRQPIATSEITFVENRRREPHLELERTQGEIGRFNKEIREAKALRQAPTPKVNGSKLSKRCPDKEHREFPTYFLLAAKEELTRELFDQVTRTAKSMLENALRMGTEEP